MYLIPILRLADNLNRSHDQRIRSVECRLRDGQVNLQLRAQGAIDLEKWAAERVAEAFQLVYNRSVSVSNVRD
jgi:exopolyphosphatase/guanosine-5'-triphosphate,3'-diphosphate pyrophosphatase